MGTLTLAACLWDTNDKSEAFSRCYSDEWAVRLFAGFRRNLTVPTRSVLFTDWARDLPAFIEQIVDPSVGSNGYGDCIRPFCLNEPMIFAGLDTVVVGNCDKFARYCFESDKMALPSHPNHPELAINGVVFCPAGQRRIFDEWRGENDMEWLRQFPHERMEKLWSGRVISVKHGLKKNRALPGPARIVYFHGEAKPHKLENLDWIRRHWIG